MYQSNIKFEQLSEKAKQQAMETYKGDYKNGEYTVIDDVIIMRCQTVSAYKEDK